jgi:hypothetical protein
MRSTRCFIVALGFLLMAHTPAAWAAGYSSIDIGDVDPQKLCLSECIATQFAAQRFCLPALSTCLEKHSSRALCQPQYDTCMKPGDDAYAACASKCQPR